MQYKITGQYARGEEQWIASFEDESDARIFINSKLSADEDARKKIMYRLYDDSGLLQAVNRENISPTHARYADADAEFTGEFAFSVRINLPNPAEKQVIADFADRADAMQFISGKCAVDPAVRDKELFFLFKNQVLLTTASKEILAQKKLVSGGSASGKGATFRPTPLPTRPTPPGGPADSWVENDDE